MSIGKSLVQLETRRAVDMRLGWGYGGKPRSVVGGIGCKEVFLVLACAARVTPGAGGGGESGRSCSFACAPNLSLVQRMTAEGSGIVLMSLIGRWNASVSNVHSSRKNTYCVSSDCEESKFGSCVAAPPGSPSTPASADGADACAEDGSDCMFALCSPICCVAFSIRAQVKYTSKRRSRKPRRIIDGCSAKSPSTLFCCFSPQISAYVKAIAFPSSKPIKQQVPIHLRLDQDKIDEQHDKIMLDIFICEALAARTLCQAHTFAERAIIGFAVRSVELVHTVAAFNAKWHRADASLPWATRLVGRTASEPREGRWSGMSEDDHMTLGISVDKRNIASYSACIFISLVAEIYRPL